MMVVILLGSTFYVPFSHFTVFGVPVYWFAALVVPWLLWVSMFLS